MYCTLSDVTEFMTEKTVLELSSDTVPISTIDEDIVEALIEQASQRIDAYLRGRYTLPIVGNLYLKRICLELVRYYLYSRRNIVKESIEKAFEHTMKELQNLQKGITILEVDEDEGETPPEFIIGSKHKTIYNIR